MIATKRTTHPHRENVSVKYAHTLALVADHVLTLAQEKAYDQGQRDCENSTRDHPPYGFSDLKQAWRAGWLAASQRAAGKRKCAG
jgi:hypothetical protein